jgi:Fe-S-cluster containining protein
MGPAVKRFACTQCGKCCNRSPEVELSEAAALADVFVFRMLFRLYCLPQQARDYVALQQAKENASAIFYQKKRLLSAFAARKYPARLQCGGKPISYTKYLVISALALDTSTGSCGALSGNRCSIYDRRPLSCRSVPLHYSRAQALAEADLKAFVETAGYRCDTSRTAPAVLNGAQIINSEIAAARSESVLAAHGDRKWGEAIVRAMRGSSSLPTMSEIEANANLGAMATSMRIAWQIAADARLIESRECDRLVELQLATIEREITARRCSQDALDVLTEMQVEYRQHLHRTRAVAATA